MGSLTSISARAINIPTRLAPLVFFESRHDPLFELVCAEVFRANASHRVSGSHIRGHEKPYSKCSRHAEQRARKPALGCPTAGRPSCSH
jgi:hypothetical protein